MNQIFDYLFDYTIFRLYGVSFRQFCKKKRKKKKKKNT